MCRLLRAPQSQTRKQTNHVHVDIFTHTHSQKHIQKHTHKTNTLTFTFKFTHLHIYTSYTSTNIQLTTPFTSVEQPQSRLHALAAATAIPTSLRKPPAARTAQSRMYVASAQAALRLVLAQFLFASKGAMAVGVGVVEVEARVHRGPSLFLVARQQPWRQVQAP